MRRGLTAGDTLRFAGIPRLEWSDERCTILGEPARRSSSPRRACRSRLRGGDPSPAQRYEGGRRLVEDAGRAGEGLHEEVEVGDASLDELHPGVVKEVLDVHPPAGGEVIDDGDVVVLR